MRKLFATITIMVMCVLTSNAQNRNITGKITDQNGTPVANVSVIVKNTKEGTSTSSDGFFSITVPPAGKILEFSSVGFESQSIAIGNKIYVSLVLVISGSKDLSEVVVTGINKIKKSQYTGASTKIDEKLIQNKPVGSFEQVLQGRVPGVEVLTGSGAPGTASTVVIRGTGSITGGNDPLYVVDGIPVEAGVFQSINPNDFASIDILRDASAAALYGSRGSAGVIIITTKKGTGGKMKVSYTGQAGIKSRPDFAFRPMNTTELLQAQNDYGAVLNRSSSYTGSTIIPGWYYAKNNPRYSTLTAAGQLAADNFLDSLSKINTDWNAAIFKRGLFSNHQISLSGGTGKTRIYSSLAFYNEDGTTLRSDQSRVTNRTNIDYIDDRFSLSISTALGYTKRNFQQSSAFNTSNPFATSGLAVPYQVITKPDGTYATGTGTKYVATNQLDQTFYDENYSAQIKSTLGFTLAYKITKYITAGLTTGIDYRETQGTNYGSKLVYTRTVSTTPTGKAGFQFESSDRNFIGDVRPNLTFRKIFAEKHDLELSAFGEYVKTAAKTFSATGYGTDPKRPNTAAAVTQGNSVNQLYSVVTGRKAEDALLSALAIARYTYNNKYTLSASIRNDNSSKLPKANRSANFYSVGGVWELSKENFIKNIGAINTLRLKASYGGAGNSNNFPANDGTYYTQAYPYQATYTQGSYSGINTIVASYPGNPDLKWERTYTANIGLDYELLNHRLYGDINVYDKRTKDLFVQKTLSSTAGFGNGFGLDVNAGVLQNKGIEWNVNVELLRQKNVVWTIFATGAYNKNKVLSLGGLTSFESGTELVTVGLPLGTQYEVKWAGVDQATGAPLYYTKEGKLTSTYSSDDAVQDYGTYEAPWKGGFGSSIQFKGFDLSVLFSWQHGAKKVDNLEYFLENPTGFLSAGYNQSSDLNFWKNPGDIATTPSPLYPVNFSSKLIHDASFVRLRDVTLAYTIPRDMIGNSKIISNLRFYVQGSNLFIWTHWRGRDPEAGAVNINISEYPNPRAFTFGLDITF